MSDYQYTDKSGENLSIAFDDCHGDHVIIETNGPVYVKPQNAPAIALAILEAAGYEASMTNVPGKGLPSVINQAAFNLAFAITYQKADESK